MIALRCFVADFNLTPDLPVVQNLTLQGQSPSYYFGRASGAAQLDVEVDMSRRDHLPGLVDPLGVTDDDLMEGLSRLLGTGGASNPLSVGLLLADSYAPSPSQYGIMFDTDGGEGLFGPRQGCAVFLTAIKQAMPDGAGDAALNEFVAYTAIHELGHAFNLWHVGTSSFMQPHPAPAHPGSCDFDPTQAHYLGLAADPQTSNFVLPGPGPRSDASYPLRSNRRSPRSRQGLRRKARAGVQGALTELISSKRWRSANERTIRSIPLYLRRIPQATADACRAVL